MEVWYSAPVVVGVMFFVFFLPVLLYQSVRVSRSRSLLLILSHSCGGRDENDCLIMQRGQPIKGPGAE